MICAALLFAESCVATLLAAVPPARCFVIESALRYSLRTFQAIHRERPVVFQYLSRRKSASASYLSEAPTGPSVSYRVNSASR
eukprot:3247801-Pleurochrysis_carterae.AAC.1